MDTHENRSPLGGRLPWITDELIEQTIDVWQPYYEEELTEEDAVEILRNVVRMARALAQR